VLVIGGGLIAKIADLDLWPRMVAASCLLVLTVAGLIPLKSAIDIVAAKLTPLSYIADAPEYAAARAYVDGLLRDRDPPPINSLAGLYREYRDQTAIANNAALPEAELAQANHTLGELLPRIREAIEIANTEYLRIKFDWLVRITVLVLPVIGASLFIFLISTHKDDATEKALAKPKALKIPWSADVESVLVKAGLPAKCFSGPPPQFLQMSEMSGLRAGVLVVPHDLGDDCPAVRVILTNSNKISNVD
jgi:hypothetical protein